MRTKVDKSQQSAYLVQVWTQYHSYAPKNRDELVSFVKTINPYRRTKLRSVHATPTFID